MCGIAGIVTTSPSAVADSVIRQMTDVLHHRGPDDSGYYRDAFASLGHRRLSIIDLSTGHQPIFNEDGKLCIIYNGELFNHVELRELLERAGHSYVSRSDTETILHAYEEYGPDCVVRFRGMFAFAIWNSATRVLFCARDRMGIKPFYYYWDGRFFAFASEIKALLQHPQISRRFDETLLPEYLALGFSSDDRTLFAGIRKLMPGHRLCLTPQGLEIDRYWQIPVAASDGDHRTDGDWIGECRRRLEESVRLRLMSDVPLGMFLSGGVDSSAIAALMKRMVPHRIKTFSVGYRETPFSELGHAAQVAQAIGTDHNEVVVGAEEFFATLPKLIWHEDEPIAWPSSVSLYFVSKLAATQVKVVLTGEGADELFGGYERYRFYLAHRRWMDRYSRLPAGLRRWLRSKVAHSQLLTASTRRKLQHTVVGRESTFESFYIDNFYAAIPVPEQERLIRFRPFQTRPYDAFMSHWNASDGASLLRRLLYTDQKTYLVELLMKQDQMSMACSIESRVPFLDHPFVEFSATVPDNLKIRRRIGKYILKGAVQDLLPSDIVYRKKMGFPTPLRAWLQGAQAVNILATLQDKKAFLADYIDRSGLTTLLEHHLAGRVDATDQIWRLLNLQLWGQVFFASSKAPCHDENTVGQI